MTTRVGRHVARAHLALAAAVVMLVASCGGGTATPSPTGPPVTAQPTAGPATAPSAAPATPASTAAMQPTAPASPQVPTESVGGAGDYQPGSIDYRVVNLLEMTSGGKPDLEVYVRTDDLVTAYRTEAGLAYGELTDYFAPPEPGTVVAMQAGTGSPTCVVNCDHLVIEASTGSGAGQGKQRTIVVYREKHPASDTPADEAANYEMWENPDADSIGKYANALPPADPAKVTILAFADAVSGADFGLRVARVGDAGCSAGVGNADGLVGGTQIVAFAYEPGPFDLTVHDSADSDCSGDPVGGPFSVLADAGSRGYLMLYGKPGAMEALTVPIR